MIYSLISIACSALCCLLGAVLFLAFVFFAYKMLSGGGGSDELGVISDVVLPTSAESEEKQPEKVEAKKRPIPDPSLPPIDKLERVPIQTSDPFDEDEMATVVAPPQMRNVPSAPPPPPPKKSGGPPPAPGAGTPPPPPVDSGAPPPPPSSDDENAATVKAPPVEPELKTEPKQPEAKKPEPKKPEPKKSIVKKTPAKKSMVKKTPAKKTPAKKKPTPPPAPPRSSGQTIIAFDDDEDF